MKKIKLHIGCGSRNFGKDWIHIDDGNYSHLDYKGDVRDLKKFVGIETVDLIYASHVIAYFDRAEIIKVLENWYSVLKPNGTLRLATPDFFMISSLYTKSEYGKFPLEKFLGPLYGKWKMGEKEIYHKTVYDFNSLKDVLEEVGFYDVKIYNWRDTEHAQFDDHSQAYLPHMDKENGALISLNVEAIK